MAEEKKSNKILIIVLIGIIILLIMALVVVYVSKNEDAEPVANQQTNIGSTAKTQQSSSTFIGDEFTILQPSGWVQSKIANTLASFVKQNETQPAGSPAEKINFQSYMAVSFDVTNGKTLDEIYKQSIDSISELVSDLNVFVVNTETINGLSGKLAGMEFTSQEVDYTVLLAIYMNGGKYYSFSFNTTTQSWPEYNTLAYQVARSFTLK